MQVFSCLCLLKGNEYGGNKPRMTFEGRYSSAAPEMKSEVSRLMYIETLITNLTFIFSRFHIVTRK